MSTSEQKGVAQSLKRLRRPSVIEFKVTDAERFIITEKARQCGIGRSSYLRQMALYGAITPRISREDWEVVSEVIGLSNSVNELVKQAKYEGVLKVVVHFEDTRNKVDEILKRIKHVQ